MWLEEQFGGRVAVFFDVLCEGGDSNHCGFEAGGEAAGFMFVEGQELGVGWTRDVDCMEFILLGSEDEEDGDDRVLLEDALGEGASVPDAVGDGGEAFVDWPSWW